jgi:hypothetical protein
VVAYTIAYVPTPERQRTLLGMVQSLRGEAVEVVSDPGRTGVWTTRKRGLLSALRTTCDHIVWLDDDLRLCRNFPRAVDRLIAQWPDDVLCLYANTKVVHDVGIGGWLSMEGTWGCANVIPAGLAREFLTWEAEHLDQDAYPPNHDDVRLAYWQRATDRRTRVVVPSLVQHVSDFSIMQGRGSTQQRATLFADDLTGDPAAIAWGTRTKRHPSNQVTRFPGWLK